MNYYKLGCNWGSRKPCFFSLLKKHSIIICADKEINKGDFVAITQGYNVIALAQLTSSRFQCTCITELENDFKDYKIDFEDWNYIAYARIWELDEQDKFEYKLQQGICQIKQPEIQNRLTSLISKIMNNEIIIKSKKLLESNYNLVLTGAPGTGKTYLAKEIAKEMGAEYKVVQFHPSYDYTDFVEGLRPVKCDNSLGFQRKDGVFKAFCKEALKNTISVDKAIEQFHADFKNNEIQIKSHKSNTKFSVRLDKKNYKIFTSSQNCPSDGYDCAFDAVKKYIITGEYQEGHQTYQPSIGEYIKKNYMNHTPYVFIIDEINRGEISKIFGELFLSIDTGYRGEEHKVDTQYQNLIPREGDPDFDPSNADVFRNGFFIPENVFIIGTMNDIDRSVESMDFAMRRRFAWKEITAKSRQSMLDEEGAWGAKVKPSDDIIEEMKNRMDNLNAAIIDQYGNEALSNKDKIGLSKAYQIGASYFLKYSLYENFDDLWTNHIEGLLYEYLRGKTNIDEKIERLHQAYNDTTKH